MKIRSVKFNFIMNFLLTISQFIFPLITFPYVSRVLKPEGVGSIASATSVITYFTMFALLGVPTYGIRACARVRDNKEELSRTVQELLIINMVMMVLCYIAFGIAMFSVEKFQQDRALLLISSGAMILNVIGVSWLYSALEQYAYITTAAMVFKIISIGLMFAFVRSKEDYIIYGGITVFASAGSYVVNFIRLRKFISLRPVRNYDFRRHLRPILVFFAMSVATTIYTNLDTVMLFFMKSNTDVGYYNAAVKVKTILVSLVTSLGIVLLPRLSFYIENGQMKEFRRMIAKAINFVLLLSLPLTVYFIFYAKESILLLSGNEFMGSVLPMCVITPSIIMIGLSNVLGIQVLVPTGREDKVLLSVIIGAIVDLFLNIVCVPKYSAVGSAIATMVAEIVVLLVQIVCLRQMLWEMKGEIHWRQIGIALIASTGVILVIKNYMSFDSVFITLFISAIIYFGVYGLVLLGVKETFVLDIVKPFIDRIKRR
jgi:O-antigen/teichoic acid export membrane protein